MCVWVYVALRCGLNDCPFLVSLSQHPSHLGNLLGDFKMWSVNDHIYFLRKCFYTVPHHYTKLSCICDHLHPSGDSRSQPLSLLLSGAVAGTWIEVCVGSPGLLGSLGLVTSHSFTGNKVQSETFPCPCWMQARWFPAGSWSKKGIGFLNMKYKLLPAVLKKQNVFVKQLSRLTADLLPVCPFLEKQGDLYSCFAFGPRWD